MRLLFTFLLIVIQGHLFVGYAIGLFTISWYLLLIPTFILAIYYIGLLVWVSIKMDDFVIKFKL